MNARMTSSRRGLALLPLLALAPLVGAACATVADDEEETNLCPTEGPGTVHDRVIIDTDTVWRAVDGPHYVEGFVYVRAGATLTIEPCTAVRLGEEASIEVGATDETTAARLIAESTPEAPITFARKDAALPWGFLLVQHPATGSLANVVLQGGGGEYPNGGYATLIVRGDFELPVKRMVSVREVTVRDSVGPGVWLRESGAFTEGSAGLTLTGNGREEAAFDDASRYPAIIAPVALTTFPSGSYTGNFVDELLIHTEDTSYGVPDLLEDVTIRDLGAPYHVGSWAGGVLRVGNDAAHPKVTLTIEPGVTLRFHPADEASSGSGLTVHHATTTEFDPLGAVLVAVGTAEKPIVFTSAREVPAAGDWTGLFFGGGTHPETRLEHVVIEYAGSDLLAGGFTCPPDNTNDGAVAILGGPPATAFLTNSIVRHSAANGIVRGWSMPPGSLTDFTATNTFEDIAECVQTVPRFDTGGCPDLSPTCE